MQKPESDQPQGLPAAGHDVAQDQQVAQQGGNPLNTVDILGGGKTARPAPLRLNQTATQQSPKPIGTAELLSDETLVLHLEAESLDGKTHGDGELIIHPSDKEYSAIRSHIGEIHQGQLKFVSPWDEPAFKDDGKKPANGGPVRGEIAPPIDITGGDKTDAKSPTDKGGPTAPDDADQTGKNAPTAGDAAAAGKTAIAAPAPIVPASQAFDTQVSIAYNAMSAQTKTIIAGHGSTVVPVHHLTDALPELRNQAPRGWPVGSTWDMVDGAWSSGRNEIVVAEERQQIGNGQWVPSGRTDQVLRHESGHAVDYTINMMSDHQDFKTAYDADVQAMPTADKNRLSYFLQSGAGGREETAAEGVADREGGATGGQPFHNDFPKTLKVINDTVNAIGAMPSKAPSQSTQPTPTPGGGATRP